MKNKLEDKKQCTFIVQTGDGVIQVLGTRFAINIFRGETKNRVRGG